MNKQTLKDAVQEAKRFIAKAKEYEDAEKNKAGFWYSNPKQSGAVRRASMDLTRKLADLRAGR